MYVERNVGGVERDVTIEQSPESLIVAARDSRISIPEQAVVHQQQAAVSGSVDRLLRRIDRGHDPLNLPAVFDLQAVQSVGVVRRFPDPEVGIEVGGKIGEPTVRRSRRDRVVRHD